MINAHEAREKSLINISKDTVSELLSAENSINKAVGEGKESCWCYTNLHEQTLQELRKLGYKVTDNSDQRDGIMFEIKWL